ncbi:MAG: hypothetical protein QOF51_2026 [Chloroflexota bacterium]|jgi:hypothetical protein|nr:hypothetical protein [Chloroflexota bacterium]
MGRYLTLLAVLAVGLGLAVPLSRSGPMTVARWPTDDTMYQVEDWAPGALQVQSFTDPEPGAILQRSYNRLGGGMAQLVVWTVPQPQAKTLFRKGPDRDFLGAGYTSEEALPEIIRPVNGGARVVRRGAEAWLLLYTFGERRGVLGDSASAWLLAESDALLDHPNDYFLARIGVPLNSPSSVEPTDATHLLDTLAARLAAWYAA